MEFMAEEGPDTEPAATLVTLKNGEQLDVRIACAEWGDIRRLVKTKPWLVSDALALAYDGTLPRPRLLALRDAALVGRSYQLRPAVHAVLRSAHPSPPAPDQPAD